MTYAFAVVLAVANAFFVFLNVLGLFEKREIIIDKVTTDLIEIITQVRESLRNEKNFQLSDKIREDLERVGIVLSDTEKGPSWKIASH